MKTSTSSTTAEKAVYADLRNDFMFKKAFSQKDIMIPFLNDILETDKILDIEYRNVEQLGFDAESAKVYYDLFCQCADGKDFIVEMQCSPQTYYRERMIFYSTYPLQHQYVEARLSMKSSQSPSGRSGLPTSCTQSISSLSQSSLWSMAMTGRRSAS